MALEIIGNISRLEIIATGGAIRESERLRKVHGPGRWKKMKGSAIVKLPDGSLARAEIHWYEAHGIGRKEFKIKRIIEDTP